MTKTSVSRSAKELDNLRDDIRKHAGFQDKTLSPSDFDFLEVDIKKELPQTSINAKTLKRFFGYDRTEESSFIRLYTLEVLSQYVGYESWNAYLGHLHLIEGNGSGDFKGEEINADDEIIETENAKWQVGDRFQCRHFIKGKPLYVDNLTDKNGVLKSAMYVVGENGGILR